MNEHDKANNCGLFYSERETKLYFVNFEWDEEKNNENIRKHGFDFADAWEIFEAPMRTALDLREMETMSGNETTAESSSGGGALKSLLGFFVKVADDEAEATPIKRPAPLPVPSAPPPAGPRNRVGDLIANEPAPKIAPPTAPASANVNLADEPFEEIYKAAGLPASQCSVDDLAKLLENPMIANQPTNIKVVAVNLTLSAKNLTTEEPITDALRRDRALDAYQAMLAERVVTIEQRNAAKLQQIS